MLHRARVSVERANSDVRRTIEALGVVPTEPQVRALGFFLELLQTWNAKSNLVGARDWPQLQDIALGDATVTASTNIVPEAAKVIDVGSGAGLPGLPLAILRPDTRVTLVEPRQKRAAFLRYAVEQLRLSDRTFIEQRRVDPSTTQSIAGAYDTALSRATFAPRQWLELGSAIAGQVIVYCTTSSEVELETNLNVIRSDTRGKLRLGQRKEYALAHGKQSRVLLVYERVSLD